MANDRARTRLYFGHVRESEILNSNSIHKYLSSYGQIVEVKVGYNFFFVEFEEASDADDVLRVFQDTPFMGLQQLAVQFARPMNREMEAKTRGRTRGRLRSPPMRRPAPRFPVTIQGLPRGICWQDLKDFARRERSDPLPVFCDISQNDHNKGFIEYSSLEEAANAVRSLNGRVFHEGRVKATMVKVCRHKS
ncbi:hypothetical protein DL96DRAFT_970486 [Flagelloscypha sp. PMI_526]|nr:hypothetical protein DL96DRAFT_970486 [Flagelloscypha sp. PMI_526]